MTEHHLEQVVAMSMAFADYMKKTHKGMDNSEYAAFRGNRYDSMTGAISAARSKRNAYIL